MAENIQPKTRGMICISFNQTLCLQSIQDFFSYLVNKPKFFFGKSFRLVCLFP
ncbi:hypothetical protein BY458DRAFT_519791 [Sporodiniella umbellata]|nr:hypothetical protein BY458DRAFT_519791 [Sporodiniella umbellata]